MLQQLGVAELAGVASALFAALAAGFALWTALQSRALVRATLMPDLSAIEHLGGQHRELAIANGGGGLAKLVHVLWVVDDKKVEGDVAAFLRGGDRVVVAAAVPSQRGPRVAGVLTCMDAARNQYVWSVDDHRKVARRRRWRKPLAPFDAWECLMEFYPDVDRSVVTDAGWTLPAKKSEMFASSSYPKAPGPQREESPEKPECPSSAVSRHTEPDLSTETA